MYGLDADTIKYLYELVFCNKFEVCMYMNIKNNILYVNKSTINEGEELLEKGSIRGLCRYKYKYEKYICHTHPYTTRSYPSLEDILKVIKHKLLIDVSIISTRWGIWTLVNKNKNFKESDININKINEYINKLGYLENSLGYKENIYVKDISPYLTNIKDICNKLSKYSFLHIKFVEWNRLQLNEDVICD